MPTTAKGANVFHASQAGIHADGDLNDQGSNSGHEEQDRPQVTLLAPLAVLPPMTVLHIMIQHLTWN